MFNPSLNKVVNSNKEGKAENDKMLGTYIVIIKIKKEMATLAEINKSIKKVGKGTIIKAKTLTTNAINSKSVCRVIKDTAKRA